MSKWPYLIFFYTGPVLFESVRQEILADIKSEAFQQIMLNLYDTDNN